jgi:hypothetical protein
MGILVLVVPCLLKQQTWKQKERHCHRQKGRTETQCTASNRNDNIFMEFSKLCAYYQLLLKSRV